jgi:hypothetical protein
VSVGVYKVRRPLAGLGSMTAVRGSASGSNVRSASTTRRDYRLSLAVLVAGGVVFVAVLVFAYVAISTGAYPSSGTGLVALAVDVIGSAGFGMIFLGSFFASHYRSLLRRATESTRPGPLG